MKENKLIAFMVGMLVLAMFLLVASYIYADRQYQLTAKMAPVFKEMKELLAYRSEKDKKEIAIAKAEEKPISTLDEKKEVVSEQVNNEKIEKPNVIFPLDVPLLNQMDEPHLYNGCEVTSLAMLLQFHGYDVSKNELAKQIKRVPFVYKNGLHGNPNDGFVGDMENGPGLTVFHKPIVELAKKYVGARVLDITGSKPQSIYDYLDQGLPVWIMTTIKLAPVNDFEVWNTPSGKIRITYQVHSVIVTGYSKDYVFVNDPYGTKNKKVDRKQFEAAWIQMGNQAIVITR